MRKNIKLNSRDLPLFKQKKMLNMPMLLREHKRDSKLIKKESRQKRKKLRLKN